MTELARPTGVDWEVANSHGQVRYGDDRNTVAFFYTRSVLNEAKSREANRPIHDNIAFVRIQPPGERLNIIERPVQDHDKRRWPQAWNDYLSGRTQVPEGTPVEMLFVNHPAIADNLKGMGVFTIEQLADLSANAMDTIGMGAQDWSNKAKAYLQSAEKGKGFNKLSEALDTANGEIRILKQQLQQAIAQLKAFEERMRDPIKNSLNPGHIEGVDVVSERINANHVTKEIFETAVRNAKAEEQSKDPFHIKF